MGPSTAVPSSSTVIGAGCQFVGDLTGDENVQVDGRLEGKIRIDRNVVIGPTGDVEGDVQARGIVVAGRIRGQVVASERAELTSSAVVFGSVLAPKIIIAEGAKLEGNVAMTGEGVPKPAAKKLED